MGLKVYEGLPASGKTKAIISEMDRRRSLGDKVMLILSMSTKSLQEGRMWRGRYDGLPRQD